MMILYMSQGCEEYANLYKQKPGQYPHEEIESQPGYTPAGNTAAASSGPRRQPGPLEPGQSTRGTKRRYT